MPEEIVRVKVRYKVPGATESDPAFETSLGLTSSEIATASDAAQLGADFQWAIAVAAFAEILKGSPYAPMDEDAFLMINDTITAQAWVDIDRVEFESLFETAVSLFLEANTSPPTE